MDETSSTVKIEKLNDTNFHAWKRKIQLVLALRDLDQYIDDERPTTESEQKAWDRGDRKAQAIIGLALSDEHLEHVAGANTAKDMWKAILDVFQRHTLLNKLAARRQFYTVSMEEGEKVLTYVNRVQHLASILKSMGVEVDDKEMGMAVLNGLPPRYDSLIVALDALGNEDKIFTLDFVKSRLLQEEQRSNMRDLDEVTKTNAALVNQPRNYGRPIYQCTNCGRNGHTAQRCWGKDINGRRPEPPSGYRQNRFDKQRKPHQGNNAENKQSALVGQTRDGVEPKLDEAEFTCLMTRMINSGAPARSSSWYVDSACTAHMTFDRSMFVSYRSVSDASVEMGTKAKTRVVGSGEVVLQVEVNGQSEKCLLKNVLHVPQFEYSLISVSTSAKLGVSMTFDDVGCRMIRDGNNIASATLTSSMLYELNICRSDNSKVHSAHVSTLSLWHQRMAHVNTRGIASMVKNNVVHGVKIDNFGKVEVCAPCVVGKCHRQPIPSERTSGRASKRLALVHSDVCGPIEVPSLGGARYFITFTDDHSEWISIYTMHRKSESFGRYKTFESSAERHTTEVIQTLRSDRGGEYMSNEFGDHLRGKGIVHQLSTVETPQQNGVSERINRTLMDLVRSMLHAKGLPKQFWAEALATAVYVRNRVTSRALPTNTTPHHIWHGNAPDLSHLRVFGCRCWYMIPKSKVKKLDGRAREAVMIGYAEQSKAYKLWDPKLEKVIVSRDVTFNESESPDLSNFRPSRSKVLTVSPEEYQDVVSLEPTTTDNISADKSLDENIGSSTEKDTPESTNGGAITEETVESQPSQEAHPDNPEEESATQEEAPGLRRSTRVSKKPTAWWRSYVSVGPQKALLSNHVPLTFAQATSGTDAAFWKPGIDAERDAHRRNGTWYLVPPSQAKNVLTSKWIFNVKDLPDSDGIFTQKAKARLVARGFQQVHGVDYNETYAPVVKLTSIRVLLAVVAQMDLELHQMDVVTAFLNGDIEEDIYMAQPEGCRDPSKPDYVCKLRKALYGLKQAPRRWNAKIDDFLLVTLKFRASPSDPCIYTKYEDGRIIIIALYVDDLLLAGNDLSAIAWIKGELSRRFEMKDLGEAKIILGLEITRDRSSHKLWLSQTKYATSVLERFGMRDCRPVATPMLQCRNNEESLDVLDQNETSSDVPYRQAIGALMYLMISTRPDLAFAVGKLARFCEKPQEKHWVAVKRVFRYISGTKDLGILFDGRLPLELNGYSDSDWAGDLGDRKSTGGFVFLMSSGPVSWSSRKQTIVAASSCEAEYISLSTASKEAIWLRRLVCDILRTAPAAALTIKSKESTSLRSDNQGAIALAHNESINRRNKHIDIAYHFVRDAVKREEVRLEYVPTTNMVADILTKPLGRVLFERFCSSMGVCSKGE